MTSPLMALEIHDLSLWQPSRVIPLLSVMQKWGYNALVLHHNDLLDEVTQLGLTANYGVSDLRLKKVRNRAAWLNELCDRLQRFGAKLFLEIKEPSFEDYAVELFPALLGADGRPDPTHPEWARFCHLKTKDILDRVPGLGGLILNLSSPESRVSMPDHHATHRGHTDKIAWFDRMIGAFEQPLSAAGKSLYVRDFSYTTDLQSDILTAVHRYEGRVQASIKITAHDYFPRSKENPALHRSDIDAIIEVDAFGEHTGWGIIPNCRVNEFRQRFHTPRAIGAKGVLVRTSWEAIIGANALDGLSAVNVFAIPHLMQGDRTADALVCEWLDSEFELTGETASQAAKLLLDSWHIPAAAYWHDQVFPRHSCLPSTWQEGWMSMETIGMGRRDHSVTITPDDPRLTNAAFDKLLAEKRNATALAIRLADQARTLRPNLPSNLAQMFAAFDWLVIFARQFEWATMATFHAARNRPSDMVEINRLKLLLLALADEMSEKLAVAKDLPFHHRVLFDPEQVRRFTASLDQRPGCA